MGKELRTAIYTRVSADHTGEQLTVTRNEEDCYRLAEQRGWPVVATFTDNSITATGKKHRPAFTALLEAIDGGEIDAVVSWSLDRLARNARDRLALVEACQQRGTIISLVKGSDMDPTTASGRMVIGVLGEVAQMEIGLKSERQTAAARQRSKLGRPPLGVRLTGYTAKGETVPDEAELVRRIFKMFYSGESLRSIARLLTEEGQATRRGTPWNPSTIRTILTNPRYAGRAVYQGQTTGETGNWEPLVTAEMFDVIQARLNDPRRTSNREGTDRKHLGSGLFLCAVCKQPCSSWSGGRYRCKAGHVNRSRAQVDGFVTLVVAERIRTAGKKIAARMKADKSPSAPLVTELDKLRDRKKRIESDYDADLIDGRRYAAAMERVGIEIGQVQQKMAADTDNAALADVLAANDPPQAFLDASLMGQRAIIGALVTVELHKAARGSRTFDPTSVEITPK
ncbi:recombinase family protein [Mycobacterium sp. Y57]|uniref:recombinase family protein n=1 Tax=Mycolicibacterium xanthum TaxID=2796469 RepID=UPI001C84C002|nr:recombinase family protein [Mycolicibacterium xanthum]MBX7433471.1 recombinase family protein [Mycolicibacterium xanthum]